MTSNQEKHWQFEPGIDGGGVLVKDGRPIAVLHPVGSGHVVDTGNLIALLLTKHEQRR